MYDILMQCPLFIGLNSDKISELIGDNSPYTVNKYKKGDVIASKDSAYSGLMIILSGSVSGEFTYTSGQSLLVDILETPQLIAPAFLFGGCNRLPVDVIAQCEDVEILTLHRGLIFDIMQEEMVILSNFIDIISNRANAWSKKIYVLSLKTLEAKFAHYLLEQSSNDITIPDVAHIAEYFGSTRSSLQTVIETLKRKQIISCVAGKIEVLNREALEDIEK